MCRKVPQSQAPRLFAMPHDDDGRWVSVAPNLDVFRGEEVWRVVHMTEVLYEFAADDVATKRLCMAQLSLAKLASEEAIAQAFGCSRPTVSRAKAAFLKGGTPGLVPKRRGPKSPRMDPGLEAAIVGLRREGLGRRAIHKRLGVPLSTIYAVCKRHGLCGPDSQKVLPLPEEAERPSEERPAQAAQEGHEEACPPALPAGGAATEVEPGEPAPARTLERVLACTGRLGRPEAAPVFVSGSEVPAAGVLLALALVAKDGCLDAARKVYGCLSNGFYGLRSVVVTLLVTAWLTVKNLEELRHGTGARREQVEEDVDDPHLLAHETVELRAQAVTEPAGVGRDADRRHRPPSVHRADDDRLAVAVIPDAG